MQTVLESFTTQFGSLLVSPSIGAAEFFVAVLVACGLVMIAISSLLPKGKADNLEWWER